MQRLVFAQYRVSGTALTDAVTSWSRCSCGGRCRSQCSHLCKSHCESHRKGQSIGRCIGQCSVMQRSPRPVWRSSACGSSQRLFVSLLIYGRELLGLLRLFRATLGALLAPACGSRLRAGVSRHLGLRALARGSRVAPACLVPQLSMCNAGRGSWISLSKGVRSKVSVARFSIGVAPGRGAAPHPRGRAAAVILAPATGRFG